MAEEKILGISLSPTKIKFVEASKQGDDCSVINWAIEKFGDGDGDAQKVKIISTFLEKNKIKTRNAILVPWESEILYQIVETPNMPDKELPQAIKYSLSGSLPFPIEETIFDYVRIQGINNVEKQYYFVAAISREYSIKANILLKNAGIEIKDVIPSASALKNAYKLPADGANVLVNIGSTSTLIVLISRNEILFAREIKVGGDNIYQSMIGELVEEGEGKLPLDAKRAKDLKLRYGIPLNLEEYSSEAKVSGVKVLSMMRPTIEKISAEILRTIEYYRVQTSDQTPFDKIYVTGGTAKTKNLITYIGQETEIATLNFPVFVKSESKEFTEAVPCMTLTIGALLAPQKGNLSLIPEELRAAPVVTAKEEFNYTLYLIAALIVLGAIWFVNYFISGNLTKELTGLQKQKAAMVQIKEISKPQQIVDRITKDFGPQENTDRFINIIKQLTSITPDDLYFKRINYSNKTNQLQISGVMIEKAGQNGLAAFIENLSKTNYFTTIDLTSLNKSKQYTIPTFDFEINCTLPSLVPVAAGSSTGEKK